MREEQPIIVTPPKELEVGGETETTLIEGTRATADSIVNQEPKEIIAPDPTREDIEITLLNTPIVEEPIVVTIKKELITPTFFKKDLEELCQQAIDKAIAEGKINPSGGGEVVEGGVTLQLLDKDDKNFYVFSCLAGSKLYDVSPYPTKANSVFAGWCSTKDDITTKVNFPITVSANTKLYPFFLAGGKCIIQNLGSENPNNVTFSKGATFPTENQAWEEVTIDGNKFAKFTKWYKKPFFESGVLKGFEISNVKESDEFKLYDCFIDENGNELDYILIGEYCMSSTTEANSVDASRAAMTIDAGRALARAKGTGYQLMDASMFNFWRDLALACSEKVNFNDGTSVASYLGLKRMTDGGWWIDGIAQNSGTLYYSSQPSKYIDHPSASSAGYSILSYTCPTTGSGNCVKNLGYDANHPTVNFPCEQSGSNNYTQYYCDGYYYASGDHPVYVSVGNAYARNGLFSFSGHNDWSVAYGVRLCYRPIA